MNFQDYDDLIIILTFAKTKLDMNIKSHQETAKKINELKNKIHAEQANLTCERY